MTAMTAAHDDDDYELTEADRAALQLALDMTLADDPPDPGRVEQVQDFLRERSWFNVASFCSYHQQMRRLNLHPAKKPPCWIAGDDEANSILAAGPQKAMDGSDFDISDCEGARLYKRMVGLGISAFHPDPLTAIATIRRAGRRP
jgi:hypothetical protein